MPKDAFPSPNSFGATFLCPNQIMESNQVYSTK
jgi:hypothetical protein